MATFRSTFQSGDGLRFYLFALFANIVTISNKRCCLRRCSSTHIVVLLLNPSCFQHNLHIVFKYNNTTASSSVSYILWYHNRLTRLFGEYVVPSKLCKQLILFGKLLAAWSDLYKMHLHELGITIHIFWNQT